MRRLTIFGVGVIASLAILIPAQTINAPIAAAGAGPNCPSWKSTTQPPDYIRVLRNQSGRVERVPFKKYVLTVLGKEWPGYLPQAVIQAGAVAVKQYAWFHALGNARVSRSGQCFDVTDGVGDQLYKPNKSRIRPDHYTALAATWGVRLTKSGSLFMTGYRTGNKGACGHDSTGWKLFARSATRCAYSGDSFLQILRIYYGPVAVVSGAGSNNDTTNGTASDKAGDAAGDAAVDFSPLTVDMTPQSTIYADGVSSAAGTTGGVGATSGVGTTVEIGSDTTAPAYVPVVTAPVTAPVVTAPVVTAPVVTAPVVTPPPAYVPVNEDIPLAVRAFTAV